MGAFDRSDLALDFRVPDLAAAPGAGPSIESHYEIVREIARGTSTIVYEARHRYTGRLVVMKAVAREAMGRETAAAGIGRAARALGAVIHPNVVELHDAGPNYVVMEKLEGRSLEGILAARRRLPVEETLYIARCIGGALGYGHRRGVVHRDVRPSNVLLCRRPYGTEAVKLIDYSAAHTGHEEPKSDRAPRSLNLGALEYMCPEQVRNAQSADPRCDQYALAAVLVECLLGSLPSLPEHGQTAPLLSELEEIVTDIPASLVFGLSKALSPNPADRFPNVEAFVDQIGARGAKPVSVLSPLRPSVQERTTTPAPKSTAGGAPAQDAVTRRRFTRAPYITPARVVRQDGSYIDGRSEDISEGGMLIVLSHKEESRVDFSANKTAGALEVVQARFALPTTGVVVSCAAIVRWVKDGRGRAALGIEFEAAPPEVLQSIRTYVSLVGNEAPR